jgi:COP9 signalosome complex subunit 7
LPKLSPSQHQKLLLLSLLPLARDNKPLSYSKLQSALSLPNVEALESLITNALYTDLIDGALDPHNQVVHIDSVAPLRDLRPGSVPTLTQAFESWSAQCASTLAELQKEIDLVNDKAKAKAQRDKRIQQIFVAKMEMSEEGKGKRGPDPNDDNDSDENGDEMDIDAEAARGSRSKRSLLGSVGRRLVG